MGQQDSWLCLTKEVDAKFSDFVEEFALLEASHSIEFKYNIFAWFSRYFHSWIYYLYEKGAHVVMEIEGY